jgi:tRNA threonylcarbamoyladenosine biosynthesis protein TsaB
VHSLYIDSTSKLVIGLLDSNYSWLEYLNFDEKKPSEIIHFEIFNLMKKYNLNFTNIQCFILNGPGSYTGMRLGEGVAQIFELNHMPIFSFYHFEVPAFCGITKGFWVTNAFKGQVFIYNWDGDQTEKHLLDKNAFTIEDEKLGFTLDVTDSIFKNLKSTQKLIIDRAPEIFAKVSDQKLRRGPYYFRSLDEEFS